MFRTVLIANRGEIAVRLIRACHELGARAVAVYSDADASAMHVRHADVAVRIGPPPPAESYLSIPALLHAAAHTGAEAVHPGYGFLAEDPTFAEACEARGIGWIGPPPAAMRTLGDKAAARTLARSIGVPVSPGYDGERQDLAFLCERALETGFPLLIKAAAGGGGRGMRPVRTIDELEEQLASARREALAAFGDGRVILERLIERPRHLEIQLMGDRHGSIVSLGERDCSIQRRHQKLVEEAPAPRIDETLRRAMGSVAVALARAAGYESAGTAEFLVDETGQYFFLEMNARLQVEHPVTELVTGLDLACLQIRLAAGEPLPFTQEQVTPRGHAIELRVVAEAPALAFLPSSGRLELVEWPAGPGVRLDAGYERGDVVSTFYDSLLGKLIVYGQDRDAALATARRALDETRIVGVATNLQLLRQVSRDPLFVAGRARTDFLTTFEFEPRTAEPPGVAWAAAAVAIVEDRRRGSGNPWTELVGWRPAGQRLRLALRCGRARAEAALARGEAGWEIAVGAERWLASVTGPGGVVSVSGGGETVAPRVIEQDGRWLVPIAGEVWGIEPGTLLEPWTAGAQTVEGSERVEAPMPGRVVRMAVKVSERVARGQLLAVLEAMKIEHRLLAPRDALVSAVHAAEGEHVELGATLLELEAT
ncbi:MAG: 3-methylcrotonyl-CoA carboxylase [Chloroflexi bacterium]|nr:3-methylcrotonyl-CoA carboxylase [Chloroflexota bacterium]